MTTITTSDFPFPYTGASSIATTAKTTYTSSLMPGAWLYSAFGSIPIYNSISDLSANQYKFNNSAAYIRVLPGYKVIHSRNINFGGTATTVDLSNNSYQLFQTASNMLSLRLYYQGIQIKNNSIPKNIPYSITNSNSSNMLDKTGLLYYYPFDTDIVNYSSALDGNTYELSSATLSTTTTKLTSGSLAIASGGHFRVPEHKIDSSIGYSIALWYKLGSVSGIGAGARIIQLATNLNIGEDIFITYPTAGSGAMQFSPKGLTVGYTYDLNYTMDTNWHHICVTCSIGGYWTVYIDSVEVSMTNKKSIPTSLVLNYCYINKSSYSADGNASCNVNQLLIFSRELKPYEIYYLYLNPTTVQLGYMQSQISNASLQYYYPLNNNFNNMVNENLLEGAINNSVNNGIISSESLSLSGQANTYFTIPPHYIGDNYSISFHFKINSYPLRDAANIFNFATQSGGNQSFRLKFSSNGGSLLQVNVNYSGNFVTDYNLALNTWVNICITFDKYNDISDNTWKVYIDGQLYKTHNRESFPYLMSKCIFAEPGANLATSVDPNTITTLNCNFKQVAIFSKTLTLSEIATLQNSNERITLSNLMYYYPFITDFYDYSKTSYPSLGIDDGTHTNVTINSGEGVNNGIYTGINSLDTNTKKTTTSSLKISNSGTAFFQIPSHYIPVNYSISLWFYLNSYSTGTYSRVFDFSAGLNGSITGGPLLAFRYANSGSLWFNSGVGSNINTGSTLNLNTWYHICVTYNGTAWNVYVNGTVTSVNNTANTASQYLLNFCYIGKSTWDVDGSSNCNINQFAVFSKRLTFDEIQDLYNKPTEPITIPNLMYYYPFDIDFYDYSQLQMMNRSANINSSLGHFIAPDHYINPTGYSISMWYKLNSYQTGTNARVFDFARALNGTTSGAVVLFFPTANSGALSFTPFNGVSSSASIGYTMDLNWHHICVIYTGSIWYIYIDSALVYQITYTPTTSLLNFCYVGKSTYTSSGNINCNVKQVAIYQRTLSVDEIRFLYDNPNCPINNNTITTSVLTNYYPCFPGCYLFVNGKTAVPLYTSITDQNWNFDQDSAWWVLPGYKIIVYTRTTYNGDSFIVDNTYGFNNMCKISDNPNTASSIKLYYKGQEIIQVSVLNSPRYTLTNSIPSSIPYKYLCNNNLDVPVTNNSQTSFPGAWIITSSGSYPIYETINDLAAIGLNASGTSYDVLPGFKLVIYTSTYLNGTATSYWNDGYSMYRIYAPTATVINSVALYFHGQPIVKKEYSNPSNMKFAISTRLVVPSYTGAIMNIRSSATGNPTQDFYSDAQQTYLTTGANNTGQTYAAWIGANTGYVKIMYDQSGQSNHCSNTTNSAQPTLSLYNGKYVMEFTRANATCLNITTPCNPNTIFSHFYNVDVSPVVPGSYIYSIITTQIDYQLRFIVSPSNTYGDFGAVGGADWYASCTGNKNAYVNNLPTTLSSFNWNVIALSAETTNMTELFNRIGTDGNASMRGLNGYMTEMICHDTQMSRLDMNHYYEDQLILTQNAIENRTTSYYSLNTTNYPSQVKGIWNNSLANPLPNINISFTYQFNYDKETTSGTFHIFIDNYGWLFINGGAPTSFEMSSKTGTFILVNGINTIEIIGYNSSTSSNPASCFAAFYDSTNTLIAYTNTDWKCKIANTINQTNRSAAPIAGGLWVTTYSFTENEGYYLIQGNNIKTPNYYSNIPNLKPASSQLISDFSSSSTVNPLVNANTTLWGFKAVGYFVPNATGIWTFTMRGDDIAQIWIGVSSTNPVVINPLTTPTSTSYDVTQTFTVSVTINVQYPILIYMGNSSSNYDVNNGINPNSFSLSVKNPSNANVTLSTIFYYLNCPLTY